MTRKFLAPTIILLLFATFLTPLNLVNVPSIHKANGATRTVSLAGFASTGWNQTNPTITITQGDSLVITTSSGDGTVQHHFFVDVNGGGMTPNCTADKCASVIPPTATDTLTGFTQGTYNYYCEYHFAMRGTFIVQALPAGPDFVINSSSTSLTIDQGSSQTSTLTISSLNGYSGTVNLTLPNTPAGISAKFLGSSSFSITASTAGSASLNITVAPSTSTGSYTLPIAGSDGTTSHTTNLSVQVTSASPASSSGLPAFLPVIVGIVIVGVMGTAAYAVLRRRPGKKGPRASR